MSLPESEKVSRSSVSASESLRAESSGSFCFSDSCNEALMANSSWLSSLVSIRLLSSCEKKRINYIKLIMIILFFPLFLSI